MENHATNPTTITINSKTIRTMTRHGKKCYHRADVIKALDSFDTSVITQDETNLATGQEINDPRQMLVSIISESALNKLAPAEPTKDEQISILKNQITILEELLMDGAGPMKAYPLSARLTEETTYLNQLSAID